VVSSILRPGDASPVATWVIVAVSIVIWVAGFFTPLPSQLLIATPRSPWQVWGFATGGFVVDGGSRNHLAWGAAHFGVSSRRHFCSHWLS